MILMSSVELCSVLYTGRESVRNIRVLVFLNYSITGIKTIKKKRSFFQIGFSQKS